MNAITFFRFGVMLAISLILLGCNSGSKTASNDKYGDRFDDVLAHLVASNYITNDSGDKLMKRYVEMEFDTSINDNMREAFVINLENEAKKLNNISSVTPQEDFLSTKKTMDEYEKHFEQGFSSVHLENSTGNMQAPLYGQYADAINYYLLEMERTDSLYKIFKDPKLNALYKLNLKKNQQAVDNYMKYGQPTDLSDFKLPCQLALKGYLNDPDYEIEKEDYYLKQNSSGYVYKLLVRGKNAYGAKILSEITFTLKYNIITKEYYVISIKE